MPTELLRIDAVERSENATISMQDVRLVAGEGKLEARHVLDAVNVILRQRAERGVGAQCTLMPGWQQNIMNWAVERFGPVALNPRERAMRFVEEALELGQTQQLNIEDAHALVRRVYSRDPGDAPKEIGQAGMTLEALAFNIGQSVPDQIAIEIERIQTIPIEEWRRRHAAKIAVGAALPSTSLCAPSSAPGEKSNTVADSTGEKTGTHGASKEAGGHSRDGNTPDTGKDD